MPSISGISALYKQAHIVDQLGAKRIRDDYLAGRCGEQVAKGRLRDLVRQGMLQLDGAA